MISTETTTPYTYGEIKIKVFRDKVIDLTKESSGAYIIIFADPIQSSALWPKDFVERNIWIIRYALTKDLK